MKTEIAKSKRDAGRVAPPPPTHQPQPRHLHTLAQLAEEAQTSRRFLEMEVARGRLRVIHLSPRVVRVRDADWQAYLSAQT